jgi:hypothetical protein
MAKSVTSHCRFFPDPPPPNAPYLIHVDFSYAGLLRTLSTVMKCKMWMNDVVESSELQCALLLKCLPILGMRSVITLMHIMPLMGPILTSTEHIRNLSEILCWTFKVRQLYKFYFCTTYMQNELLLIEEPFLKHLYMKRGICKGE